MDEHYCVFGIPKVDRELDFHGVEVQATSQDFKEFLEKAVGLIEQEDLQLRRQAIESIIEAQI